MISPNSLTPPMSPTPIMNFPPLNLNGLVVNGRSSVLASNGTGPTASHTHIANGNHSIDPVPPSRKPRTLCLCFDGTGNKFGLHVSSPVPTHQKPDLTGLIQNSNVVRLFRALKKDNDEEQLAYYQAGIGTYNKRQFRTYTLSYIASALDQAIARQLPDHVKDGYKFLMQNYHHGDRICLFGFSRGAYTARALAGMLYKVGLLPAHNDQQLDFAFSMYSSTDLGSAVTSREFKETFSIDVEVEFLGVWDTVSSVGVIPRVLPYSSSCYGVKVFRHALALDERRARFRPSIWGEPRANEEMLDRPIPDTLRPANVSRDEWVYDPPVDHLDIKEVWFSGCHADIGGGSHVKDENESLSNIALRWMISECKDANVGIQFDDRVLKEFGVESHTAHEANATLLASDQPSALTRLGEKVLRRFAKDDTDAVARIYDQLSTVRWWWPLEVIPTLVTWQNVTGGWMRARIPNFGEGRIIPHRDHKVSVHASVRKRIETEPSYKPMALNWDLINDLRVVEWVS
ncbi:hypothetical protein JAAARDRAFT_211072 [Jaapia argillacea MUCL 33604]|uniref:T6SS Phospholipase effector Tle1-like catalytic domain-containing protein n=1 Tax=Jaapia argillacea MUCL 33604 TaxID=933084 RepID=A0A067PCB8_9AGAM|nr:hypothetical protein JAAARDRAFT_211072 [Jaapia argillacea MUCL 33604]